jgi:hypothetical protein
LEMLVDPAELGALEGLAELAGLEPVERVYPTGPAEMRAGPIESATAARNHDHPERRLLVVEAAVLVEDRRGPAVREGPQAWEGQAAEGQAAADAGGKCTMNGDTL